jgi:hypothetical protein
MTRRLAWRGLTTVLAQCGLPLKKFIILASFCQVYSSRLRQIALQP